MLLGAASSGDLGFGAAEPGFLRVVFLSVADFDRRVAFGLPLVLALFVAAFCFFCFLDTAKKFDLVSLSSTARNGK